MKISVLLSALLSLLLLSACQMDMIPCGPCEDEPGIILPMAAGPVSDCHDVFFTADQRWIIEDDSYYQALSLHNQFSPLACDSVQFEPVDFSQYTILSMAADASGCEQYFCPKVEKLDAEQKYRFTITVQECGGCEPLVIRRFWVVVPKLPDGYTVDFEVVKN
jgi:hypothetical protein